MTPRPADVWPVLTVGLLTNPANGQNAVVAAIANRSILVLGYVLSAPSAVIFKWRSGASTELSGAGLNLAAEGGAVAPFNPFGWFETAEGAALTFNINGDVDVGGHVTYCLVTKTMTI